MVDKPICVGSFSGCGGSSLGYKYAGFDVRAAIEFDSASVDIYKLNHPNTQVMHADIRNVTSDAIMSALDLSVGELHLWEGSPPCSKFSMAGRREKGWNALTASDSEMRLRNVEDLFFDWIRLLKEMQPMIAVAENVVGLTIGTAKGKLVQFVRAIEQAGYFVRVWKLNAADYGTPQTRRRVFIFCVRNDLNPAKATPPQPTVKRWVSIREATKDLPTVVWTNAERQKDAPSIHHAPSLMGYKKYHDWQETLYGKSHHKHFSLIRTNIDKPAPTICATDGQVGMSVVCHGLEPRMFSIAETRRLFGYPDNYKFTGTYKDCMARLGNSVPPLLAQAVATRAMAVLVDNEVN